MPILVLKLRPIVGNGHTEIVCELYRPTCVESQDKQSADKGDFVAEGVIVVDGVDVIVVLGVAVVVIDNVPVDVRVVVVDGVDVRVDVIEGDDVTLTPGSDGITFEYPSFLHP